MNKLTLDKQKEMLEQAKKIIKEVKSLQYNNGGMKKEK